MENEWVQWSKYVLKSLEKNERDHEMMMAKLDLLREDTTVLKMKMALIGFVGGMVPTCILILLRLGQII
jgi:hypothetical protein